ncbi:MAG: F0F1 ATP synthase subunit epsilon [Parvularculales bacterium]
MSEGLHFDLVSPERLLISEPVRMVVTPGVEGDFAVLPGHAPVMTVVRPGVLHIEGTEGEERRVFVRGGFAEVKQGGDLTMLAEEAILLEDLNAETLDQHIRNTEEDIADAKDDATRERARQNLDQLRQLRDALDI